MRVMILHIDDCLSWEEAGRRTRIALDEVGLTAVNIGFSLIETGEDAVAVPFAGSPTILIDGVDAFPTGERTTDLACRIYQTEDGLAGLPSITQLVRTLRSLVQSS